MADEVGDQIENALNLIVSTKEQSGNMKKGLKQRIFETVSTLRELFVKLMATGDSKTNEISKLTEQVTKMKAELQQCSGTQAKNAERHLLSTVRF
jgi:polyhydroxyalkanoate synthesis regulator phasin